MKPSWIRVGHLEPSGSHNGAHLLLNNDPKESFKLASELNQFNDERKNIEKNLLNIVLNKVGDKINDPVIVLEGDNWHEGIIGIIASRIKDKFNNKDPDIYKNGSIKTIEKIKFFWLK